MAPPICRNGWQANRHSFHEHGSAGFSKTWEYKDIRLRGAVDQLLSHTPTRKVNVLIDRELCSLGLQRTSNLTVANDLKLSGDHFKYPREGLEQ
jgi:hypothetical protein